MSSFDPFANQNSATAVFLGGSITEGHKASSPKTSYVGLVSKYLSDRFAGKTVACFNAGIGGTGSNFGRLRMARDVLSHDPDLVFVEFAVNDAGRDRRAEMESIVRTLMAGEKTPYIVFLYTASRTYSTVTAYHEQVAAHYGIPSVDLQAYLKEKTGAADPVEAGLFLDSVHPLDGGFAIYAEAIIRALEEPETFRKPKAVKPLFENSRPVRATFTPSPELAHSSGWQTETRHRCYACLHANSPGETVSFSFDGTLFGMEVGLHRASGVLDVSLDGKPLDTVGAYYDMDSFQCVLGRVFTGLPDGRHTVTLTLRESTGDHPGSEFVLYHVVTGTEQ